MSTVIVVSDAFESGFISTFRLPVTKADCESSVETLDRRDKRSFVEKSCWVLFMASCYSRISIPDMNVNILCDECPFRDAILSRLPMIAR